MAAPGSAPAHTNTSVCSASTPAATPAKQTPETPTQADSSSAAHLFYGRKVGKRQAYMPLGIRQGGWQKVSTNPHAGTTTSGPNCSMLTLPPRAEQAGRLRGACALCSAASARWRFSERAPDDAGDGVSFVFPAGAGVTGPPLAAGAATVLGRLLTDHRARCYGCADRRRRAAAYAATQHPWPASVAVWGFIQKVHSSSTSVRPCAGLPNRQTVMGQHTTQ